MDMVYILYEERESSQLCGIRGVWATWDNAIKQMRLLIEDNELYSDISEINYQEGYSESDPMYSEDVYSNYYIKEEQLHYM